MSRPVIVSRGVSRSRSVRAVTDLLRAAGCVFAEEEAALLVDAAATPADLAVLVDRRVAGRPLEHVLGWVEFCGLRVGVDPGVFVPRRRTELLAHRATALARPGATVVDLGCGTGAVGLAVATMTGGVRLYAADIDPAAVECARRNVAGVGGQVYAGDLFAALPGQLRGTVDVLVANVPYVPSAEIDLLPREARIHEPMVALDGGGDGLDVIRRVAATAGDWLAGHGHLLLETSGDQAGTVADTLAAAGFAPTVAADDDRGATIVVGRPAAVLAHGAVQDAVGMPSGGGASAAAGYSLTGPPSSSVS
nr:putative protein N(5)-glutamine methyltransferase [Micromonospora sp. DSM 115978]